MNIHTLLKMPLSSKKRTLTLYECYGASMGRPLRSISTSPKPVVVTLAPTLAGAGK